MSHVRLIANYLPQYHSIPENDKWWGKGYTDWNAVRACRPEFEGHNQPRVPLDENYYSLDNLDNIKWQVGLAKKYGIDGFGIYHYWFNSNLMLLQKPAELILNNADVDIPFFFIWDNSTWKRTWSNVKTGNDWAPLYEGKRTAGDTGILAMLDYGQEEDWRKHFNYLLSFFKDDRYIKINNKPVFCIFNSNNDFETIKKMSEKWDAWAREEGFSGLHLISAKNNDKEKLEYNYMYAPFGNGTLNNFEKVMLKLYKKICAIFKRNEIFDYDKVWKRLLNNARKCQDDSTCYGGFVGYDDSPRRGRKGRIVLGQSPEKFKIYMKQLIKLSNDRNKDFIFLTAWNEWGEGAYLEPDTENGYAYLEALKGAVESVNAENA
jgi:hypothetical protein